MSPRSNPIDYMILNLSIIKTQFYSSHWVRTRTGGMCFSILQVPKCSVHVLATSWFKNFHSLSKNAGNRSCFRFLGSNTYGLQGEQSKRWSRKLINTKSEGGKKNIPTSKTRNLRHEISDGSITSSTKLNINTSEISELQRIQYSDIQQKDLVGGENSTFQTLVNPERYVPNAHIHGISTHMVNRPDVPRMRDLIPILLQYVKSRQKSGGHVLWIAHNARNFDVPFLANEFSRCSFEVPSDWLFMDTLPLAREAMKSRGLKLPPKVSLPALRELFDIESVGSAHRAMADVMTLSLVLQRLTFDLKLPVASLIERSFRVSDLSTGRKKKNSG